ncbi:alpha/beta hydrolase [Candidatus Babeliales bacterium]|nr:alpha/beta hydrolase [Candidatus Babeliales bacterium]
MRYEFQAYVFLIVLAIFGQIISHELSDNFQASINAYQQYLLASKQVLNGLEVQTVSFSVKKNAETEETFERKGLLALRPDALGTVIICHGYTQSKHEAFFLKILFSHFNVLAFDFRAHGEMIEKGQFSTIGRDEVFDVLGAVQFVKSLPSSVEKPIIGFGFSMGAVSLLQAQAQYKNLFDLLILDSPFDSSSACMERNIDRMLTFQFLGKERKFPGKAVLMKMLYSEKMSPVVKKFFRWASGMNPYVVPTKFVPVIPLENAANVTVPCFFISCECDKSVQVDSVMRLYDAVQSPFKRLWITKGRKHCGSCLAQPELYAYKVNKFIHAVLKKDFRVSEKIRDDRVVIETI